MLNETERYRDTTDGLVREASHIDFVNEKRHEKWWKISMV